MGLSTKPYLIRAIHEWCTDSGYRAYIAVSVDSRTVVPREFVRAGEIVLNVSPAATNRLQLGNELIEFEARFGGVARAVSIPIDNVSAIYAQETGQGMAFEVVKPLAIVPADEQGPDSPLAGAEPDAGAPAEPAAGVPPKSRRPKLRAVPSTRPAPEPEAEAEAPVTVSPTASEPDAEEAAEKPRRRKSPAGSRLSETGSKTRAKTKTSSGTKTSTGTKTSSGTKASASDKVEDGDEAPAAAKPRAVRTRKTAKPADAASKAEDLAGPQSSGPSAEGSPDDEPPKPPRRGPPRLTRVK